MKDWWILFACNAVIPLVLLLGGGLMSRNRLRRINALVGYRTQRSMQNDETWRFANRRCGKYFLILGGVTLALAVAGQLALLHAREKALTFFTLGLMCAELVLIFVCIGRTERALKRNFPGNEKK